MVNYDQPVWVIWISASIGGQGNFFFMSGFIIVFYAIPDGIFKKFLHLRIIL